MKSIYKDPNQTPRDEQTLDRITVTSDTTKGKMSQRAGKTISQTERV